MMSIVSAPDDENAEAVRLNLAQIAAAPDAWRARAISAGGFLGAAAAVTLLSLSQETSRVGGSATWVVGAAALCYLLAVVAFLIASVLPSPQFDGQGIESAADQLHASATQESRPIRIMVLVGAGLGALAITLTSIGIFLVLMRPLREEATVSFSDKDQQDAARRLCPALTEVFVADVTDDGSEMLRLTLTGKYCPQRSTELLVPRTAIVQSHFDR